MPLVIMCGIPSSGKTTQANILSSYLQTINKKSIIINEETIKVDKNKSYKDAKEEKILRGTFLAEGERLISNDVTVIMDSLNYIKGYRYELFCRARSQHTPSCVIHCDITRETAMEWNIAREKSDQWEEVLLNELSDRFEVPNARNRWDRPLFTLHEANKLPVEEIKSLLFDNTEPLQKNTATEFAKIEEPNFLYEMDQITQSIITVILETQGNMLGEIVVPKSKQKVLLKRKVSLAELNRTRKQFLKMVTSKSEKVGTSIGDSFVIYLNANLF